MAALPQRRVRNRFEAAYILCMIEREALTYAHSGDSATMDQAAGDRNGKIAWQIRQYRDEDLVGIVALCTEKEMLENYPRVVFRIIVSRVIPGDVWKNYNIRKLQERRRQRQWLWIRHICIRTFKTQTFSSHAFYVVTQSCGGDGV